ncbi:MAG: hypothetical protein HYR73_01270 [Candidatus Eisenbacteria bacterium]|nr:hypothetical protein [Candidatus Eisenbacteria bacterium]
MSDFNRVVARYVNGAVLKGTTQDFFPNRPVFHLQPPGAPSVQIRCRELKAVFFVKDLEGNEKRQDLRGFIEAPAESQHGKKIVVRFRDGELLCGYTLTFTPDREGFFVFPADPGSNNHRVYVMTPAALEIKAGPSAEALAHRILGTRAA